jgi:hypothetical protein
MKVFLKLPFWVALLCMMTGNVFLSAQIAPLTTGERKDRAKDSIKELKEGVLILRLESHDKKIAKLTELKEKSMGYKRKEIESRIQYTIQERDETHRFLLEAFREKYSFSDYLVMYDTETIALFRGEREGIFLNDELEADPSIVMNTENYFIAELGYTDPQKDARVFGLIVLDAQSKKLDRPFPYFSKLNDPDLPWVSPDKTYRKTVAILNRDLHRYYGKVIY